MRIEDFIAGSKAEHQDAISLLSALETWPDSATVSKRDCLRIVAAVYVALKQGDASFVADELGNRTYNVTIGESVSVMTVGG